MADVFERNGYRKGQGKASKREAQESQSQGENASEDSGRVKRILKRVFLPAPDKLGTGHLKGMGRLGLKELRNAFVLSGETITSDDLGIFGNATPGEIAQQREQPKEGSVAADNVQKNYSDAEQEKPRKNKGLSL